MEPLRELAFSFFLLWPFFFPYLLYEANRELTFQNLHRILFSRAHERPERHHVYSAFSLLVVAHTRYPRGTHTHTHTHTSTRARTHTTHTHTHTKTYARTHAHTHTHACIYIYIYIYIGVGRRVRQLHWDACGAVTKPAAPQRRTSRDAASHGHPRSVTGA